MTKQGHIERRRAREKLVVSQMIGIYCTAHHDAAERTERAYSRDLLCPACKELDDYALARTEACKSMATKTSCEECVHHCYLPVMRERIRDVMRYAGPRMIFKHPVAALRHLLGR